MSTLKKEISQLELRMANQRFRSPVDVDVPNAQYNQQVSIEWYYEMEVRSWGIKSISPIVPDQTIVVQMEDDEGEESGEQKFHLKNVHVDIIHSDSVSGDIQLSPESLEIHNEKVTVTFRA